MNLLFGPVGGKKHKVRPFTKEEAAACLENKDSGF